MKEQDQLTRAEASERLDVSIKTLERWARLGIGPTPIKRGPRFVRYDRAEVEAFRSGHCAPAEQVS